MEKKKHGKELKIFMMDGEPSGIWSCELSKWNAKAYKIPRVEYKKILDISELNSPAIYFLLGHSAEGEKPAIYIGESEDGIKRIESHAKNSDKDYWREVILFISKDKYLNKARIKYLENKFYNIAKEVGRYDVMNKTEPTKSSISDSEEATMEQFIEFAKIVTPVLGHKTFEPLRHKVEVEEKEIFECYEIKSSDIQSTGIQTSEGFVVLRGSKVREKATESAELSSQNYIRFRNQCFDDGTIVNGILNKDLFFSSPSFAASFAYGVALVA